MIVEEDLDMLLLEGLKHEYGTRYLNVYMNIVHMRAKQVKLDLYIKRRVLKEFNSNFLLKK